jgi:hypothetical protein
LALGDTEEIQSVRDQHQPTSPQITALLYVLGATAPGVLLFLSVYFLWPGAWWPLALLGPVGSGVVVLRAHTTWKPRLILFGMLPIIVAVSLVVALLVGSSVFLTGEPAVD